MLVGRGCHTKTIFIQRKTSSFQLQGREVKSDVNSRFNDQKKKKRQALLQYMSDYNT